MSTQWITRRESLALAEKSWVEDAEVFEEARLVFLGGVVTFKRWLRKRKSANTESLEENEGKRLLNCQPLTGALSDTDTWHYKAFLKQGMHSFFSQFLTVDQTACSREFNCITDRICSGRNLICHHTSYLKLTFFNLCLTHLGGGVYDCFWTCKHAFNTAQSPICIVVI